MAIPRKPATIMDVAAASGVSYATVSRYLNGNPHVSAKAAERIAAAVKQVNYTPNNAARSLVRQRTQTVAFVVHGQPDSLIADPNINTILLNANQTLGNADYQLITLISDSPAAGARIARLASSGFADGWILNTFHKDDPLFQRFANISVPVAISGVGYGSAIPFPTVDIDNRLASRKLTKHMLGRGYRRIAYIIGPPYLPCSDERLLGFQDAMAGDFDPALVIRSDGWTRPDGRNAVVRLLDSLAEPSGSRLAGADASVPELLAEHHIDALICGSDCIAAGAMNYLLDRGVRVPDDIAIAGFDDSADATAMHPQLTTVHQPMDAFGVSLATLVLDQIEGRPFQRTVFLPTEVVARGSTGE